jgi:prolipoprotein diacylglyceryltransferase
VAALWHVAILSGAFWVGVALLARSQERGVRSLLGLALSGALAHWGWCVQHAAAIDAQVWLDPARGATVLALPLGFLLAAPWHLGRTRVLRFLGSGWLALLPCLAVARTACLVAGCCPGRLLELAVAWGGLSLLRHPVELYEIVAWVALWWLLSRVPIERVPALFALSFGATRLLVCPLRAPASSATSAHFSPEAFAVTWIAAGLLGICLRRHYRLRAMGVAIPLAPKPAA